MHARKKNLALAKRKGRSPRRALHPPTLDARPAREPPLGVALGITIEGISTRSNRAVGGSRVRPVGSSRRRAMTSRPRAIATYRRSPVQSPPEPNFS